MARWYQRCHWILQHANPPGKRHPYRIPFLQAVCQIGLGEDERGPPIERLELPLLQGNPRKQGTLHVQEAVRHVEMGFTCLAFLVCDPRSATLRPATQDLARYVDFTWIEFRWGHHDRAEAGAGAGPVLRLGEIERIGCFNAVVGDIVAASESQQLHLPCAGQAIDTDQFGLGHQPLRIGWSRQRLAVPNHGVRLSFLEELGPAAGRAFAVFLLVHVDLIARRLLGLRSRAVWRCLRGSRRPTRPATGAGRRTGPLTGFIRYGAPGSHGSCARSAKDSLSVAPALFRRRSSVASRPVSHPPWS